MCSQNMHLQGKIIWILFEQFNVNKYKMCKKDQIIHVWAWFHFN